MRAREPDFREPQSRDPHSNLTVLHCLLFTGAMLAIYGWGLVCLESQLARQATPALVATR